MDTIIVVSDKKKSESYKPDFVTASNRTNKNPNSSASTAVALQDYKHGAVSIALKIALSSMPAVMFGSLINEIGTKAILSVIERKSDSLHENEEEAEKELEQLTDIMEDFYVSQSEVDRLGFKFPPGHPQQMIPYKLHPLAKDKPEAKGNIYIPEDNFSSVLLDEREAELIRLLVQLGATKIEIMKTRKESWGNDIQAVVNGGVKGLGEAKANIRNSDSNNLHSDNVRTYKLKGKLWRDTDRIDTKDYSWLPYETSWQSLINAREIGGCLSATIEIKGMTVYSSKLSAGLGMKYKLLNADASFSYDQNEKNNSSYTVNVEFNEPHNS